MILLFQVGLAWDYQIINWNRVKAKFLAESLVKFLSKYLANHLRIFLSLCERASLILN